MTPHLRALAIPFGGPIGGRDLDGEYFSASTRTGLTFNSVLPVRWHHDEDVFGGVRGDLGRAHHWRMSPKAGWVCDMDLDTGNPVFELLAEHAHAYPLFASTLARRHRRERDGHLSVWEPEEVSLTGSPQNIAAVVVARPNGGSR